MNLSGLASARPNFFHPDGSVAAEEPEEEGPRTLEEVAILNGQCACGEVRFTVENAFNRSQNKLTGSNFADRPNLQPGFSPDPTHGTSAGCSFPFYDPATGAFSDCCFTNYVFSTATLMADGDQLCCVATEGHYRVPDEAKTEMVCVVLTAKGMETLTLKAFAAKYGWKNNPARARMVGR